MLKRFSFFFLSLSLMDCGLALALPSVKVHLIENLSPTEQGVLQKIMEKKGFLLSHQPLFNESKDALVITRTLGNVFEPASIQLEVIRKEETNSLPRRIFNLKLETEDLQQALEKLPAPEKLKAIPVAFQN